VVGLLLLILLAGRSAAASTSTGAASERSIPQAAAFLQLKRAIEQHYYSYDPEWIEPYLARARVLAEMAPAQWYPHYYAGILYIQRGNIIRADDREGAYRAYRQAREHLEAAHRLSPSAETLLWMSAVYGKLASMRTLRMIFYGARSKAFMEEAYALAQDNPKFYMLAGVHMMHTPKLFGGGQARARTFLQRALDLTPNWRETDALVVRWALRPEIWAHLAQAAVFAGDASEARRYFEKALRAQPGFGFVIRDVGPQLDVLEKFP
jgi:tetratricopeptide (TPR) repeat protein